MIKQLLLICMVLIGISGLLGFPRISQADEPESSALPEWQPPSGLPITSPKMLGWLVSTRKQVVRVIPTRPTAHALIQGNLGAEKRVEFFPTILPRSFGDLMQVNTPTALPWRQNVRLLMYFHDISGTLRTSKCSGALIDPMHVLTAGHCVFIHEANAIMAHTFVETGTVTPAYALNQAPFGTAQAVAFWAFDGWVNQQDYNWDMGLITLDRPIGAVVGWFGYGINTADSFFVNNNFYNPGYPSESPYNGEIMYYWMGSFDRMTTDILYLGQSAYKGQSGSVAYLPDNNNNGVIYGVLSHRNMQTLETGIVRLTPIKLQAIQSQIALDTPIQPHLIPLRVKLSARQVEAGDSLSSMTILLHNYATASWQGQALIKTYLSTDTTVTTANILLNSQIYQGTLGAKQQYEVNLTPPMLPRSLQGDYWLGVTVETCGGATPYQATNSQDMAQLSITPALIVPTPELTRRTYLPLLMVMSTWKCE